MNAATTGTPVVLICDNFLCSRTKVDDPESIEVYPGEFEPFCPTCRHGLRFVTWDIVTGR
jgi:hypothetical protein